jgi:hypothetical protein
MSKAYPEDHFPEPSVRAKPKGRTSKATTMDRKLIAKTQQYEVSYFARKHRISAADARAILQDAGRSRQKANQMAEAGKKRK